MSSRRLHQSIHLPSPISHLSLPGNCSSSGGEHQWRRSSTVPSPPWPSLHRRPERAAPWPRIQRRPRQRDLKPLQPPPPSSVGSWHGTHAASCALGEPSSFIRIGIVDYDGGTRG